MKNMILSLLYVVLLVAFAPVHAQDRTPVSSITTATWQQYRHMYGQSSLCSKEEITLWSCEIGKRVYSLCSSQVVTRTSGYMQYRASHRSKVVFTYPAEKKPPLGSFVYGSSANGITTVEFENRGYKYTIVEPIRGDSSILVSGPAPSGKETEIGCQANHANYALTINYTMRLMYDSGVWADY